MKKLILLLTSVFIYSWSTAQELTFLDSLRMQFESEANQMRTEFEEYAAQATAEYEQYVKSITNIWGTDTLITDTKTEWVEYTPNKLSRSIVNFESGEITVEIVVDSDKLKDSAFINSQMSRAIEYMLNSRGSTCPYPSKVETSEPLTVNPVLDNLVDFSKYDLSSVKEDTSYVVSKKKAAPPMPKVKGKELELARAKTEVKPPKKKPSLASVKSQKKQEPKIEKKVSNAAIAQNIAKQSRKELAPIKTVVDGKPAQVVQVKMNLVSDNLQKNAAVYKDLVAEFSEKFQVEQPLIYAIMEQESNFNPKAVSSANALGLMQIVPNKAGVDAYMYVYKKYKIPERSYLFNARNNIELGTAYLRILSNMFKKVSDDMCRQLCVIASYNTGAGNVSTCFIGNTKVSKAIPHIDKMDYDRLYSHLVTKLPASETRDYVEKVTKRRKKYLK